MGGPRSVDLAEDLGDALDDVGTEDADVACQALGLDAPSPDGVLDTVDGLA
jgi:hypothetical protein